MKTPLLSNPLTFPALVSTTVTRSEATTLRRSHGACDSRRPTSEAASGAADTLDNPIVVLAIAAQDAAIPLNSFLRSLEIGTERSSCDCFSTLFTAHSFLGLLRFQAVSDQNQRYPRRTHRQGPKTRDRQSESWRGD
jgi:hypothetical protein